MVKREKAWAPRSSRGVTNASRPWIPACAGMTNASRGATNASRGATNASRGVTNASRGMTTQVSCHSREICHSRAGGNPRLLVGLLILLLTQATIISCKIGGSDSSGGEGGSETVNTNPGNSGSAGSLNSKLTIIQASPTGVTSTTYNITTVGQSPLRVQNP